MSRTKLQEGGGVSGVKEASHKNFATLSGYWGTFQLKPPP